MAQVLRLFDLFGEPSIAAGWPQSVQPTTGLLANWPPPTFQVWLAAINDAFVLSAVRTGAEGDRVAIEAKLEMTQVPGYPSGLPFVIASMPDVEFRLHYATPIENKIQLFVSLSDRGAEIVLERVPVEIRLPRGLVATHPTDAYSGLPSNAAEVTVGEFHAGRLDDLKIVYRREEPTSVFVHVRVHVTEDGEFDIRPAVPVSFGPCLFSGIPCVALHDFQLIPSPSLAPTTVHWLRHSVLPWAPDLVGPLDGCFSIRSVQLDPDTEPLKDLSSWLHDIGKPTAEEQPNVMSVDPASRAEFVLDDLVIPFYSPWVIPVPRHATAGVRRRVVDADDPMQVFSFAEAPVRIVMRSPPLGFLINSLFYTSQPDGSGLTFDIVVVGSTAGDDAKNHPVGLGISLEENYTLALSYRRDIDPVEKLPVVAETQPFKTIDKFLHYTIVTVTIDIVAVTVGFSFGRFFGDKASAGDSFEVLGDLFISMPASGAEGIIELKGLDREPVKFILEGIGYRFGSPQIDGVKMPDGVMLLIASKFALIFQEIGIRAEQGATYFSFSGGLVISLPSGFEGGLTVRRLRFRISGNTGAPPFKLDGFFLFIHTKTFFIEVGGYYIEERSDTLNRREFGLTGTIKFETGGKKFELNLDFIIGHVTTALPLPPEDFDYLMVQIVLRVTIQIQCVEVLSFRLLFARNMKPKLRPVDRDARDLRYYQWYKENDPLTVPGERRLSSWESRIDSIAVGAGFGISFSGMGTVFDLTAFALFLWGPDEKGLLIVVEMRLLGNPKPIAYLAIELDFQNGRWSGILGLALTIDNFVDNAPEWLAKIGQLSGTIFFGNDPNTFAIGRLKDQRTWLGVRFNCKMSDAANLQIEFLICLELVENGPKGFGLVARFEGRLDVEILVVSFSMGLGIMISALTTASHDFAFVAWLDAAFRIVLFRFLNFGVSANVTGRNVGSQPSRGEVRFEAHLETPWFLPDVTWTWDVTFGSLAPADLATSTSPLLAAGATEGPQLKSSRVHVEHFDASFASRSFDPNQSQNTPARTFSVNELRAPTRPEATRLTNFANDAAAGAIATDATITVDWAVAVNDKLALTTGVASGRGDQRSGDLALTYDLVGMAIRRRARFGGSLSWHAVDQRVELPADFSDPSGVKLGGAFSAQEIATRWDLGVRVEGGPAPKRLLINSVTPFQFATSDPETDEELVRLNPEWPCCPDRKGQLPLVHSITFADELVGTEIDTPRFFSNSASRADFFRPVVAAEHLLPGLGPGVVVARVRPGYPGVLARATFDDDVAYCMVRLAWTSGAGALSIVARNAAGAVVGTRDIPLVSGSAFQTVVIGGTAPIRRVELCYLGTPTAGVPEVYSSSHHAPPIFVEIAGALYIAVRDYITYAGAATCDDTDDELHAAYEGKGKLFFLPNHEYEVALTTRVTVKHPSTGPTSADVIEHLYFRTKGLPGLNAVERVGEEIEPYVRSTYRGGRGVLYREEPVVLAFAEGFSIAVPLTLRPAGSAAEHTTLLRMQLVVRPDVATTPETPFTATSRDWIVENRTVGLLTESPTWLLVESAGTSVGSVMISKDPSRARLAQLTQRPGAKCALADPRKVVGTVLLAPPQGTAAPDDPATALWPAGVAHTATVLAEGAPFVERIAFDPADASALEFSLDAGAGDASGWSISSGALVVSAGSQRRYAIFGEPTWNHFQISVQIQLDAVAGSSAGVAIALPTGAVPSDGLFAFISVGAAGRRLVLARRVGGAAPAEIKGVALPAASSSTDPITLQVWAFDDQVRAAVGETVVQAERGGMREGRGALVAQGPARFTELRLQGLEMYTFPFTTSRYRSFHDHVQSWRGDLAVILPNVLGQNTTTGTVGGLWTATQGDVAAAMHPDAAATLRDDLFARWVRELGLPLQDEVMDLEMSRFVVNGQTACLLLESPEPIDFTSEVKVTLERGVAVPVPPAPRPAPGRILDRFGSNLTGQPARPGRPSQRVDVNPELFTAIGAPGVLPTAAGTVVTPQMPQTTMTYEDVPVRVIQDGGGRRAVIVAVSGNVAASVPGGTYRLTFALTRERWSTQDPPDTTNRYADSAQMTIAL